MSQNYQEGLQRLKQHVEQFAQTHGYDHAEGGRLPRNHVWRPYRYCIQDVLFGATVVRQHRDLNCLEVDVFLTADIPEYGPLAGAKALTVFLISEAYKCGGTMEIRFTRQVEDGRVPAELCHLAKKLEIELSAVEQGILTSRESRQLYAASTDFSSELRTVMDRLQEAGKLSIERACYAIHHGVWTQPEAEAIILASRHPDRILAGQALPEQRHLYWYDLQQACGAILGGFLDRRLAFREHTDESGVTYDLEDDVRHLQIDFDPDIYAKLYRSSEEIPIPWLANDQGDSQIVPPDEGMVVLIRARHAAGLAQYLEDDLRQAVQVKQAGQADDRASPVFVLVPADFHELGQQRGHFLNLARQLQIGVLICPGFMVNIADDAGQRLARSRVMRDE